MNPWLRARNLLAVRLDNAGDVVMLGPALRAVKETSPWANVTLLASPAGAAAAGLLPWVDDVLVWRAVWQDLGGGLPRDPARELELVGRLAERGFDTALVFTSFSQSPHAPAYLCYLAGIPLRAGESKEFGGACLTDGPSGAPDDLHQVERNLRLVEALGFVARDRRLAVAVPAAARAAVPDLLRRAGLDPAAPFVLVHPGASAQARRYPPERMGAVARGLTERGRAVLLTGVGREEALVRQVAALAPAAGVLVGDASLPEYAALVERASVVVCGNTLPLHLADALGTPTVVPFAGTDLEAQWRPRDTETRLLRRPTACYPCYLFRCPIGHPCLDIPAEEVVGAVEEVLAGAMSVAPHCRTAPARAERAGGSLISPRRIAVLRALHLGDLLCATPALRALKARFPEAEVTLVGLPWARDLVERLPSLDRFAEFPGHPGQPEVPYEPERAAVFLAAERGRGYDVALQFHGDGRTSNAFVAALGAPLTLGFRPAPERDGRLTLGLPWDPDEHEVRRWLRLVGLLGGGTDDLRLDFPVRPEEEARAAGLLRPVLGEGFGPLVGLHAGAKEPARRWPAARFAALGDALTERRGARLVLTGTEGERPVTGALRGALAAPNSRDALDLTGRTDLGTLAAVLARLDLLVTNDTGASHLAAAVGTPSVVLFGPSRPERWAPLDRRRHRVIDARDYTDDPLIEAPLSGLPLAPVLAAALSALDGDHSNRQLLAPCSPAEAACAG